MKKYLMAIFVCLITFSVYAQSNSKRSYITDLRDYKFDSWIIRKGTQIEFSDSTKGIVKTIRLYKENKNEVVYLGIKLNNEVVDFDIQKEITTGFIIPPDGVRINNSSKNTLSDNNRDITLNEGNLEHPDSVKTQNNILSMRIAELDNRVRVSGYAFEKYHKQHTTGTILLLLGTGVAAGGLAVGSTPAGAVGAGVSLIGAIITLTAPIHIKRAGIILSGNGITMPINYR